MSEEEEWRCAECDGTGKALPDCETCGGDGWIEDEEDGGTMTCPDCQDEACDICRGTGEKPVEEPDEQ